MLNKLGSHVSDHCVWRGRSRDMNPDVKNDAPNRSWDVNSGEARGMPIRTIKVPSQGYGYGCLMVVRALWKLVKRRYNLWLRWQELEIAIDCGSWKVITQWMHVLEIAYKREPPMEGGGNQDNNNILIASNIQNCWDLTWLMLGTKLCI